MKDLVSLLLFVSSFSVLAGDKIDKTIDASPDGLVEIHNTRGEISISGWDKSQVSVKGTLDDLAESFVFETTGSKTIVKVKLPRNTNFRSRDGSKLTINVPKGAKVSFSGVATDLKINTIMKGVDINSVSGDVTLSDIKGRTYINNVSGELSLNNIEGSLEVSTVSGDVKAKVNSNKIVLSGVSAELNIETNQIDSATVSTVSGDAFITGALNSSGEVKMSSVSAEAVFFVRGELNATVAIETAPGGDIVNQYSEDKPKTSFINSQNLQFTSGDGTGAVRMTTVSGEVGIKVK